MVPDKYLSHTPITYYGYFLVATDVTVLSIMDYRYFAEGQARPAPPGPPPPGQQTAFFSSFFGSYL